MKLGTFAQVSRGVKDLDEAVPFYEMLGFKVIGRDTNPYPWVQLSDGMITVLLNKDDNGYLGLTYFAPDMKERAEEMKQNGVELHDMPYEIPNIYQKMFKDPNELWVAIVGYDAKNNRGESTSKLGSFGEFTVPVKDLNETLEFWKKLGFDDHGCVNQSPYPWAIMHDDIWTFGFHQTTEFKSMAITYFAPDAAERIADLRSKGVEFLVEMPNAKGVVTNAVFKSPDGQVFNLFEGDVKAPTV